MNNAPSTSSESESQTKQNSSSIVARVILFALLGLVLLAAGYDYLFARNQVAEGYAQLVQRDEELSAAGTLFTDEEVHKLLAKKPDVENPNHLTKVETYRWQSVIPGREYLLWVVYRMNINDQWGVDSFGRGGEPELTPLADRSSDGDAPLGEGPAASDEAGRQPVGPMPPVERQGNKP